AQLDDLERDAAAHRLLLLRHIDDTAAAFADVFEQLIAAYAVAGLFRDQDNGRPRAERRLLEKVPRRLFGSKQGLDLFAHFRLVPAGLGDETRAFVRRRSSHRLA